MRSFEMDFYLSYFTAHVTETGSWNSFIASNDTLQRVMDHFVGKECRNLIVSEYFSQKLHQLLQSLVSFIADIEIPCENQTILYRAQFYYENNKILCRATEVTSLINQYLNHIAGAEKQMNLMVSTDRITGLKNQRVFYHQLDNLLKLSKRYNTPLSLIIFSSKFDNLEEVTGQEILKSAAGLLQKSSRESDLLFRFNNGDFYLILPQTDKTGGKKQLERLLLRLKELECPEDQLLWEYAVSSFHPEDFVHTDDMDLAQTVLGKTLKQLKSRA